MKVFNQEYFKYQLLNSNNEYIRDIESVESANVTYSALSRLKQKATVSVTLDKMSKININNRIRIIHVLNDVETSLGTFLMTTPVQEVNSLFKIVSIECYSTLWLLDANKTTGRMVVGVGTNVVNEVKRLLAGYGVQVLIDNSTKTTSVTREWEIGTPILDICNDLLQSINYTSLYVNPSGDYIAKPYEMPADRFVDFEYREDDIANIVENNLTSELDYFNVPNVFVKYVNNPDTPDLIAVYENTNPQSPTSTANRPKNVHSEEVSDVSDVQTLMDMCKRDLENATSKYHKVTIQTAINPEHGYMNTIFLNLNGISGKFTETDWDIDCITGGVMTHQLRESVVV